MPIANAQYGNSNSTITPELLQECKRLGIDVGACSENAIMSKIPRSCPSCLTETTPPLDPIVISIMIGSGIALVTGIFAVGRIKGVK